MICFEELIQSLKDNTYRASSLHIPYFLINQIETPKEISEEWQTAFLCDDVCRNLAKTWNHLSNEVPVHRVPYKTEEFLCENEQDENIDPSSSLIPMGDIKSMKMPRDPNPHVKIVPNIPSLTRLMDALKNNTTVEWLSLEDCSLGNDGAAIVGQMLVANKKIKILNLANTRLEASGIAEISLALYSNNTVREISLRNNRLNGKDLLPLLKVLHTRNIVQALDLSGNFLIHETLQNLASWLVEKNCSLRALSMNRITRRMAGNEYDETLNIGVLFSGLGDNSSLEYLEVQHNPLFLHEIICLAQALGKNKYLKSLSLIDAMLYYKNAYFIRDALIVNTTLTYLNLSINDGLTMMATGVTANGQDRISEWGARRIIQGVTQNKGLKVFVMRDCKLQMSNHFSELLLKNKTLLNLDVGNNWFQKDDFYFLEGIKNNNTLLKMQYHNFNFASAGGPRLDSSAGELQRYQQRPFNQVNKKLAANREKKEMETFLQGTHASIGKNSSIFNTLVNSPIFDKHLLPLMFQFIKEDQSSFTENNAMENGHSRSGASNSGEESMDTSNHAQDKTQDKDRWADLQMLNKDKRDLPKIIFTINGSAAVKPIAASNNFEEVKQNVETELDLPSETKGNSEHVSKKRKHHEIIPEAQALLQNGNGQVQPMEQSTTVESNVPFTLASNAIGLNAPANPISHEAMQIVEPQDNSTNQGAAKRPRLR